MRKAKLSALLILLSLLTGHQAWANHCGFPGPDQVIIYQQANRGDRCAVLGVGNYPNSSHLGGVPNDSISALDVGSNVRAVLYQHTGFSGLQAHYEGGRYYDPLGNVNDRTTSIKIFPMLGGPAATWYLGNYPSARENFWSDLAQGLANDGTNWFVTTKSKIFKVPLSVSLSSSSTSGLIQTEIPAQLANLGYDHFGDPDQNSGFLFVPVEREDLHPQIAVFSAVDLRFLSSFELSDSPHWSVPWLTIRPGDRTLWLSSSKGNHLRVYDIRWDLLSTDEQLVLERRPQVAPLLKRDDGPLESVQGGVFNPEGTLLYISTGSCGDGYVYVYALDDATTTAQLQARSENGYGPFNFETHDRNLGDCDEAEGLDWLDVRGLNIPGIPDGQLHLVMVDVDAFQDQVYVKHYSSMIAPECIYGYVWREANRNDFVCVTGETRTQTQYDNSQAAARRNPDGGPYGPDTCFEGFVWREAFPGDHVCVTGETREQTMEDNRLANSRRQPLS